MPKSYLATKSHAEESNLRLKIVTIGFVVFTFLFVGRLFYWQVIKGGELGAQARAQHVRGEKIVAQRGDILASDGSWLAASVDSWLVYASLPDLEKSPREISQLLAPHFVSEPEEKMEINKPQDIKETAEKEEEEKWDKEEAINLEKARIENALSQNNVVWVPIKNKITREIKETIESYEIKGLGFQIQESRLYPENTTASRLLGFVGKDDTGEDKGYSGLEGYYDLQLSGRQGYRKRESNALGVPLISRSEAELAASSGISLLTHIDKTVQFTIEKALGEAIERYGAQSGTIVVMDPRDGGIVGMTSYPPYNPAKYNEYGDEYFKNPAVSDTFEPGSILKPVVMASALDAGVITADTVCDICDGPFKVDKYFIRTWNDKYSPNATMVDVIKNSDNVGMVFIGNKLGKDVLYDYFDRFGFTKETGIDLQGEAKAQLRAKEKWSIVDLATASFGQGLAVTPIQMVQAIGAIANDGVLMAPQVIDKYVKDGWQEDVEPLSKGKVISEEAAEQMTQMMIAAVKEGEAKWAVPEGFEIAGKTGTAQIAVGGNYDEEKTNASFIGFAPAQDPKFVMLVTLNEPQTSPWASETAAPLWFNIALDLFPYYGIHPDN